MILNKKEQKTKKRLQDYMILYRAHINKECDAIEFSLYNYVDVEKAFNAFPKYSIYKLYDMAKFIYKNNDVDIDFMAQLIVNDVVADLYIELWHNNLMLGKYNILGD